MGKTSKPLKIRVHPDLWEWPEIRELATKGHTITVDNTLTDEDLVLGPGCWRLDKSTRDYLDIALAEGRKARYPKP